METKEKNRKIDFKKLKTEAKKMNTSGGKGSLGIDQVLMVILLVTIPAGISEIPYVLLTKWNSSIYTEVCGLIVMCLIQAPFITAFYLNIIRMIKRGKIEINLPITKKALIITFITQLIGYIIGNDLFKGSILSKAICIGVSILIMIFGAAVIYVTDVKKCSILDGIAIGVRLAIKNINEFIGLIETLLPVILLIFITFGIVLVFEFTYIQTMFFLVIDELLERECYNE